MQTLLQARILDHLRLRFGNDLRPGDRINEAEVAKQFGVSRTPIRRVLEALESEGVLKLEPRSGFVLQDLSLLRRAANEPADELLDERIMRDMATGRLNSVASERALMQRYSVPNGMLISTLRRLTRDHLAEPSPGRGWIFTDVSPKAMADSYRYRLIIEPAGLLADDYKVDAAALRTLDEEHVEAIENVQHFDRRRLFDLDARFHRLIAQGAPTIQLAAAIERQNNIRRVSEYMGFIRIDRLHQSMIEHREILAALIAGDRQVAAALMRIHLQVSYDETFKHMEGDLELVRGGKVRLTE